MSKTEKAAKSAKSAASWSKTLEDVIHQINEALANMGLIDKQSSVVPSMKDKAQMEKQGVAMSELEDELVEAGGGGVLITDVRKAVLNLTGYEVLQKLKDGSLSAVLVLQAFQAKAIEESKRTNCITEFIPEAKKWAESLDAVKFGQMSDVQLPLHGFPISIKDNINVEGLDSTLGLKKRINSPAEHDAIVVQVLKRLGAIPFVKTNVSQICLSIGCSNPVWGMTVNPHDLMRTCGGSSGGEGALIAGGGSLLGVGTDIGGSIRLPACFCGVVGIKPTARRVSNKGIAHSLPGAVGVSSSTGFLGRDSSIVVEATKALLSGDISQYDSETPPLPWREAYFTGHNKKVLRIGWYDNDEIFPPTPGVKRAVSETTAILKRQGHELVPFTPPGVNEGLKLFMDFLMADQGNTAYGLWKGETIDPDLNWYKQASQVPANLKSVAKPLMKHQFGEISAETAVTTISSAYDLWKRLADRAGFVEAFLRSWKKEELDVLVCPCFPMPAPKLELVSKVTLAFFYCGLYNLLDFPAASLPITRETEEDQSNLKDYVPTDYVHEMIKEATEGATGMPLGVQVVALPYCEEVLCRAVMEITKGSTFKL